MAYNGREGFNYFYKNTCGVVKESIRSPNFGNLSERKDPSMKGMFLKLKIGNRKSEMGNTGGVPILTCYLNLGTSGADGVILIKQQWSQFSQ
jgi:hypothetical protein